MAEKILQNVTCKDRPTMEQLMKIMRTRHIDIATKWHVLGPELLVNNNVMQDIEANHCSDVSTCCRVMFEKWLEKTPDASWDELVTALNDIDMKTAADFITKQFESVSPVNTSSINSIDFTDCPDISTAFLLLTAELPKLLKRADFSTLRRALLQQSITPRGIQFPDDLHQSIKAAVDLDTLLDILTGSKYWSWVDLRLLDALIVSSGIQEAKLLIQKYKDAIFPKKLSEILPLQQKEHKDAYILRVATMIEKEPNEITVGDLARNCNILEVVIMDISNGSCVLEHLSTGQGHQSKSKCGPASATIDNEGFSQNEILQQEPKIGDLFEFVVPEIKAHWEDVAYTALRYDIPTVDGIQRKHLNDVKKCCQEMFKIWLTTPHGVKPKTWSTLLTQFKKVEELVVGTEVIEKKLKNLKL